MPFPAIAETVTRAFEKHRPRAADSLETIEEADRLTRETVRREHTNTR
jgi:1-deoxy-D-xylulose 5-phosphate reductoisomerase